MMYFLPFVLCMGAFTGAIFSTPTPLGFAIWLSGFTGTLTFFMFKSELPSSAIGLYLIEETLSFALLGGWALGGGGVYIMILIVFKSGLAPLHQWMLEIFHGTKSGTLLWALTAHKIPMLALLSSFKFLAMTTWFLLSFVTGAILLFALGSLNSLLILSSNNTVAMIFALMCLAGKWLLFFLVYIMILWTALLPLYHTLNSSLLLFGLMGMPPLLLFQMKWAILESLWQTNLPLLLAFILGAGATALAYVRFILFLELEEHMLGGAPYTPSWIVISCALPTG